MTCGPTPSGELIHGAWQTYLDRRLDAEQSRDITDGIIAAGAWAAWFALATGERRDGSDSFDRRAAEAAWAAVLSTRDQAVASSEAASRSPELRSLRQTATADGVAAGRAWGVFVTLFTPTAWNPSAERSAITA